jgi:SulP family sulfate permease
MSNNGQTSANSSKGIISKLTAAGIFGILNTSFAVSYASLIFSSTAPTYFVVTVALFLVGGCLVSIIICSLSSYSGVIAFIQDVPVAISGLIALSLAAMLQGANPDVLFANIFTSIALATILTGTAFLLLGHFKLGNLVRFIPYPVMGGFLAATGWLLFKGGLQVSTGVGFQVLQVASFFKQADPGLLICALVFGVGLLMLTRRFPGNGLVTPVTIVGSILLFLLAARLLGYGMDYLDSNGWLLGPLPEEPLWRSAALPDWNLIDWPIVFSQTGSIATIVVLSVISMLLNSTGIEFIAGRDLDINRDLKASGIANLITGFIGAPSSYVFISQTALATRMGARDRSVGILHGFFLLLVFFVGGTFLDFFPKFVAAGLPIYLGLSMMWEWLIDARRSVPRVDFAIIVGILLIVEFFGFLEGIGIGIVASVVIFVFRYSSIDIIKNKFDGRSYRSSKDRSITDQRLLDHHSDQLVILQLQGFIFFGTANSLYEKIKQLTTQAEKALRFVVLDLLLVQGIDSSAVKSFEKLARDLETKDIHLVIVNSSETVKTAFEADGLNSSDFERLRYFDDLEHATEWCEDLIAENEARKIEAAKMEGQETVADLFQAVYADMMAALEIQVMFETLIERMQAYLDKLEVSAGDHLYRQDEISTDVYFIVRGQVTLVGTNLEGTSYRFRTLGPWTLTGEIGAFLGYHAPYDAAVEKVGLIYRLTAENREKLEAEDPALASDLQRLIITMLGSQLMKTTRAVGGIAG